MEIRKILLHDYDYAWGKSWRKKKCTIRMMPDKQRKKQKHARGLGKYTHGHTPIIRKEEHNLKTRKLGGIKILPRWGSYSRKRQKNKNKNQGTKLKQNQHEQKPT
jgi:hypothetical protein